jgi:hypothetical protein
MRKWNKIRRYLKGFLIGMVFEFSYRFEFGWIQFLLLAALITEFLIDISSNEE